MRRFALPRDHPSRVCATPLSLLTRLGPGLEQIAHSRPLVGSELGAVAADASAGEALVLGNERGRCRHGMGDCGAASKSGREGILLGPLYGSRRPHLTLLGDTGSTRCDESNRTDLWELIVSGLVRSPSGDEVEDECRTRDPHERATFVSAVHDDELVRFRNLALEDAFQEELVVCREPVEKTCDLGPRGHLSQRTQHDGPRKS